WGRRVAPAVLQDAGLGVPVLGDPLHLASPVIYRAFVSLTQLVENQHRGAELDRLVRLDHLLVKLGEAAPVLERQVARLGGVPGAVFDVLGRLGARALALAADV